MRMCLVGAWGRVWGSMRWRRGIRRVGGRRLRGSIREEGRGRGGRAAEGGANCWCIVNWLVFIGRSKFEKVAMDR